MNITLKLYASLSDYLPVSAKKNIAPLDVDETTTVQVLLDQFKIPDEMAHLVLINGVYLAPEERTQVLQEGDVMAVWPPVAGG